MDESADLISSLYPPPPPYYRYHTDENLAKLREWKRDQISKADLKEPTGPDDGESPLKPPITNSNDGNGGHTDSEDIKNVQNVDKDQAKTEQDELKFDGYPTPPGELKLLVPPKQPTGEHYRGYGNIWLFEDKLPSLKQMGLQQLYPEGEINSVTKIKELHKLLDSLLLNFLELVGVMSIEPEKFGDKIENIKTLLINMNHILNSYRPHQSRESLILLLKKQIEYKRLEIKQIEDSSVEISQKLKQTLQELSSQAVQPISVDSEVNVPTSDGNELDDVINQLLERNVL